MSHAARCDNCGVYGDVAGGQVYVGSTAMPEGWLWAGWHWGGRPENVRVDRGGVYCRVACAAAALQREHAPPVGA